MHQIVHNLREPRLRAPSAVVAEARRLGGAVGTVLRRDRGLPLTRKAAMRRVALNTWDQADGLTYPHGDSVVASPSDLVPLHHGVPVVSADRHCVRVEARKNARVDERVLRPLHEECARPLEGDKEHDQLNAQEANSSKQGNELLPI